MSAPPPSVTAASLRRRECSGGFGGGVRPGQRRLSRRRRLEAADHGGGGGRNPRHDRPLGLGQDDGAACRRRLRASGVRAHPHRRDRRDRPAALRARPRDGRAELRAVSPHARLRERRLRPAARAAPPRTWSPERVEESLEDRRHVAIRRSASRASSPAASSSASRSPARSRSGRRVLLLDEPLSALDAQIRRSMVEEIARLHADLPDLTILYVTHDQSEALTLADRIAILKDGELSAIGRTGELYRRPPNRFAAEFLGRANLLPVVVEGTAQRAGFVARAHRRDQGLVVAGADHRRRRAAALVRAAAESDADRRRRTIEPHRGGAARDPLAGRTDPSRRRDRRARSCASSRRGCRTRQRAASG